MKYYALRGRKNYNPVLGLGFDPALAYIDDSQDWDNGEWRMESWEEVLPLEEGTEAHARAVHFFENIRDFYCQYDMEERMAWIAEEAFKEAGE